MKSKSTLFIFGLFALGFVCCKQIQLAEAPASTPPDLKIYRVELGKRLFYDPILSRDSTISCATCHKQELAFTDGLTKSIGIREQIVSRNAPTLTNVGNRPYLLWDGVNPSLESQVGVPVQEHTEFDFNVLLILERLKRNELYVDLAKMGFGTEITEAVFVKSIAEFERTLISDQSPYDRYLSGNKDALTASQIRGKKLFFKELYCGECHTGKDLTNDALTNNGLYESYSDSGRIRLTRKESDRAIFKVPTLRNIALTAPYMHDGSKESLIDVLDHYSSGGKNHSQKSEVIKSFELTDQNKEDLINFFDALTDSVFIQNPAFRLN